MNATYLCLILFATSLTAAADQSKTPNSTVLTVAPQTTVRYSQPWRPSGVKYSNAKELIFVSREKRVTEISARVLITTEQRLSHEDALRRLRDIAELSTNGTARFVEIGGWPAVVLEFMEPLAQPGAPQEPAHDQAEPAPDDSPAQRAIVAVAAGTTVVDFDITLAPGAPHSLLQQAEEIASSSVFPKKGNPEEVHKSILDLQHSIPKPPATEQRSSNPQAAQPNTETIHLPNVPAMKSDKKTEEPGSPVFVQGGIGELEVVASLHADDIVIASNKALAFSNNQGAEFHKGSTGVFGLNDPTLARGASGNFYLGVIAYPKGTPAQKNVNGCTNAVSRSTDKGARFSLQGYSAFCPRAGTGLCFPDQPHIAADGFNLASGKDQVYAVWRNLAPAGPTTETCDKHPGSETASISCSIDNGVHWTPTTAMNTFGHVPRIAVGKDGSVYVVTILGTEIFLSRFSSCSSGLLPAAGFPVTVANIPATVACPVPGLDRCNGGNTLTSPTVAPDPSDASKLFVTYAQRDNAGGEQIITAASNNRGAGFQRFSVVTSTTGIRRFMPWSCVTQGRSWVSWYDREAATAPGATDDLTDFRLSSTDGSQVGTSFNLTQNPDPQCASGWKCGTRKTSDSNSCTLPQLAGVCRNSNKGGSKDRCNFEAPVCPIGETCQLSSGCPKYGDYNGIACADDFVIAAWSSATAPKGLPAVRGLSVFASVLAVGPACTISTDGCAGQYSISITCNGPNIGVRYPGCFDTSGEPTACVAGFNNSSTVTATWEGENTTTSGAVLGPFNGQVCTTDGPFQKCITIDPPPVAVACNRGNNPIQKCNSDSEEWCAKWNRCVRKGQCLIQSTPK